nr:hypothetical protein JG3_0160 [uncultured bacterium]
MSKENLRYLVEEYKLCRIRLDELKSEYLRIETALDVHKELEKELEMEIKHARIGNDSEKLKFWQHLLEHYWPKDKDLPDADEQKKAKEKVLGEQYAKIVYYERKLISIKRILGPREAELLESYLEKNLLMGQGGETGNRLLQETEEMKEEQRLEKKKKDVTFDKM